eukprot:gnl/TRDRNA2_/TRDRNA2_202994_c0_seq1.p1 gnl/TRDRNA2_/TRDRNA2_202994_c0~~gnl/TRDRNA2_/TRDRNA2_202994_c0_seq1.p1  ORF type:complete len:279 (+),score=44.86 gnl/TRDRNA2_/TRDRNA2_202994_c0_seq1:46-882(+)
MDLQEGKPDTVQSRLPSPWRCDTRCRQPCGSESDEEVISEALCSNDGDCNLDADGIAGVVHSSSETRLPRSSDAEAPTASGSSNDGDGSELDARTQTTKLQFSEAGDSGCSSIAEASSFDDWHPCREVALCGVVIDCVVEMLNREDEPAASPRFTADPEEWGSCCRCHPHSEPLRTRPRSLHLQGASRPKFEKKIPTDVGIRALQEVDIDQIKKQVNRELRNFYTHIDKESPSEFAVAKNYYYRHPFYKGAPDKCANWKTKFSSVPQSSEAAGERGLA